MYELTPCYTVSGKVYRTGNSAPVCNWTTNGYRLPSEAEWENAARGGASALNFPWGNTIAQSQANYYAKPTPSYSYDLSKSPTSGYHPTYAINDFPYTSPVGSFAANGHGLYDMAGNVWQWCWDFYLSGYTASAQTDPHGITNGTRRVFRGGSWGDDAKTARCSARNSYDPAGKSYAFGFRLARTTVP